MAVPYGGVLENHPEDDDIGYSPERLEDAVKAGGGIDKTMAGVQSARYNEVGAPDIFKKLSPTQLAAIDRYTSFAKMRQQSKNPLEAGVNLVGGLGAMAATELSKKLGTDKGLSWLYNKWRGTPGAANFFGGVGKSPASMGNLTSSLWGFLRKPSEPGNSGPGN